MSADDIFTKDNLEKYLKDLSKEFRKLNGSKMSAEIINSSRWCFNIVKLWF